MVVESNSKWSSKVAASGRRKYTEYLEWQCADKAKFAKWVNRKTLSDEKRQKTVQCAVMSMTKDADTLSEQAEAQNGMTLVMKSNAFSRSAEEKDEEHALLAKKMVKLCEDVQM